MPRAQENITEKYISTIVKASVHGSKEAMKYSIDPTNQNAQC